MIMVLSIMMPNVASSKKNIPNSRLESKNHALLVTKMAQIDTLFQTKMAPWGTMLLIVLTSIFTIGQVFDSQLTEGLKILQSIHAWKISREKLTVKQFSLTLQDGYSGHESTKTRMAQIIFTTKLPCLCKNISYNNLRQPNIPKMTKRSSAKSMFFSESNPSHALFWAMMTAFRIGTFYF